MYKLAKTDITFTNAYELSAADGISSAAEANGVKTIGKRSVDESVLYRNT